MDRRKKLGVFLPPRQKNQYLINRERATIGILYPDLLDGILAELRTQDDIQLIEDLNFRNAVIVDGKVWCDEICLNDLDRFFWYCEVNNQPGSYDLEVLRTLARDTEVVNDPIAMETCMDKYRAHLCLKDAGVKVPECILFDYRMPGRLDSVLNEWGAALLKPRRGGWGKGITLIDTPERLRDIMGYVQSTAQSSPDHGFFLERYHRNDPSRWASTTMINGQLAMAYRKKPERFHDLGDGRLKVQDIEEVGGGVVLAELTPEHFEEAYRASEALGLGVVGFDMIWTETGPMIVDENTYPGNYAHLYAEMETDPSTLFVGLALEGLEKSKAPLNSI